MEQNSERSLVQRVAALEAEVVRLRSECAQLRARVESPICEPFRVVDDSGKTLLEVARRGQLAHLRLLDPNGHFLVTLTGIPSGGSIAVHDRAGAEVVGIASGPRGGSLAISDRSAQLVAWMNVTEAGGHIVTRDSRGVITSMHPGPGDRALDDAQLTESPEAAEPDNPVSAETSAG